MQALATKWRPQKFEDVCSQTSIIKILKRQLEREELKNTYLFCGASGCGKTTIARIFANEINNHQGNPIEIDGASNNGVDNVKDIISQARERSLESKYKIYIIDECHMLTTQAWNAFLKCIEEPPMYTIFIFCTTDPQKIPATILNRCMRFNFNRISSDVIKSRLEYICSQEGLSNYSDACDYISRICGGQMRDAISLLEKCASYDTSLDINNALQALGNYSYDNYFKLITSILSKDEKEVLNIVNQAYNNGDDLRLFVEQFLSFCLDANKYLLFGDCSLTRIPSSYSDSLNKIVAFDNANKFYGYIINRLLNLKNFIKTDTDIKTSIEVFMLNIARGL